MMELNRLDKIINEVLDKSISIEILNRPEFVHKYVNDKGLDLDVIIEIFELNNREKISFCDILSGLDYLKCGIDSSSIVKVTRNKYLAFSILCNKIHQILKDGKTFNLYEIKDLIYSAKKQILNSLENDVKLEDDIIQEQIDGTYFAYGNNKNAQILEKIEQLSRRSVDEDYLYLQNSAKLSTDDPLFWYLRLKYFAYLDKLDNKCYYHTISLNEALRQQLLELASDAYIVYKEKFIEFLSFYFGNDATLDELCPQTFSWEFMSVEEELNTKKYLINLMLFDYYRYNLAAPDEYSKFIIENTLDDTLNLFINDFEFRKQILLCVLDEQNYLKDVKEDMSNEVLKKFRPISTIDKLLK